MTLPKQYKKLIRRMAQSRFPGEENDIVAKADQQYSEFWKTTPDIGGKDNMQFKDLDFLIAFFYVSELGFLQSAWIRRLYACDLRAGSQDRRSHAWHPDQNTYGGCRG